MLDVERTLTLELSFEALETTACTTDGGGAINGTPLILAGTGSVDKR
jgi:hypothetical protein